MHIDTGWRPTVRTSWSQRDHCIHSHTICMIQVIREFRRSKPFRCSGWICCILMEVELMEVEAEWSRSFYAGKQRTDVNKCTYFHNVVRIPNRHAKTLLRLRNRKHEDLLALWVAFNAEAMQQPTSSTLSMFQSLSMLWPVLLKSLVGKESSDQWQEKSLASSFAGYLHELSRWPQHYENDVTAWSFQTLGFAMIWNCWKRPPLLKCSDTVCLSSIKTSKRSGTSETCTTCMSLRRLTFHEPGPRWNHQSSSYLSSTLALNFPQYYPIVYISATFSNIHAVYELTEIVLGDTLAFTALHTVRRGRLSLIRIENHKEQSLNCCTWLVWAFSMAPRAQTAGLFPTILFCIVTRSLGCFCRALGQYMLSSSHVPRYCMLEILSDSSPSQRTAQHAHKITEAATLVKQLRKKPYREAWGTCKEAWGFAGSLGCLQCLSWNSLQQRWYDPPSSLTAPMSPMSGCRATMGDTLAITIHQTTVTRGRLSLIRIENHKEQVCSLSCWTWLVWVQYSAWRHMCQQQDAVGLCPRILFRIVTSLACFCRALGCCVRRLTTLAISAFICPCPKILYDWDSFWHFPLATHCTACTQNHWSCNPPHAAPQKDLQGSMRNMQGTMRICWLFGLPSTQKLCTNQPHVLCPCSNLSESRDPFSSKTLSVKS